MKRFNKRVTGVKASTVALFEGFFAGLIGLAVAILFSIANTVELAESTDSVLAGFTFGLAAGAVAIIVTPLIYFGIGWIIGYIHGFIINWLLAESGGIALSIEDSRED